MTSISPDFVLRVYNSTLEKKKRPKNMIIIINSKSFIKVVNSEGRGKIK